MRRYFLLIIAILQVVGAVLLFTRLAELLRQGQLGQFAPSEKLVFGAFALIYLLGLIGSILIWMGRSGGVFASLVHQLCLVPVFILPGVFAYAMGDGVSLVLVMVRSGTGTVFTLNGSIGTASMLGVLNLAPATSYYGANLVALICAAYLILAPRHAPAMGTPASEPIPDSSP